MVRFVGEPVVAIVTEEKYQGADAADLVWIDLEPLPVLIDAEEALRSDVLLFPDVGTNLSTDLQFGTDDSLFDGCDVVVSQRMVNQRVAPCPLEVRTAAAAWIDGRLVHWLAGRRGELRTGGRTRRRSAGCSGRSAATAGAARGPGDRTTRGPTRCIQAGAWGTIPAWKSNAAPTPARIGASSRSRISAIHFSCLGWPVPTQTTSALDALIAAATSRCSSSSSSRKGGE